MRAKIPGTINVMAKRIKKLKIIPNIAFAICDSVVPPVDRFFCVDHGDC